MRGRRLLPAALICSALLAATAAADGYDVQLTRSFSPGAKFRLSAKASRTLTNAISRGGEVVRQDEVTFLVELQALVEILEVDYAGRPIKEAIGVEFFVYGIGDELTDSVSTGTLIVAETVGLHTEFTVNGERLPAIVDEALEMVVGTYQADIPDEDYIFGTVKVHGVGDSWKIHREAFAKLMRANGGQVDTEALEGNVTLRGVERFSGVDCLDILAEVEIREFNMTDLPEGVESGGGRGRVTLAGLFPLDSGLNKLRDATSVDIEAELRHTEGRMAGSTVRARTVQVGEKTMVPFGD